VLESLLGPDYTGELVTMSRQYSMSWDSIRRREISIDFVSLKLVHWLTNQYSIATRIGKSRTKL
jgi:hypothetical protein